MKSFAESALPAPCHRRLRFLRQKSPFADEHCSRNQTLKIPFNKTGGRLQKPTLDYSEYSDCFAIAPQSETVVITDPVERSAVKNDNLRRTVHKQHCRLIHGRAAFDFADQRQRFKALIQRFAHCRQTFGNRIAYGTAAPADRQSVLGCIPQFAEANLQLDCTASDQPERLQQRHTFALELLFRVLPQKVTGCQRERRIAGQRLLLCQHQRGIFTAQCKQLRLQSLQPLFKLALLGSERGIHFFRLTELLQLSLISECRMARKAT